MVRDLGGDQGPVGEQADEQPLLLGIGVNIQEVFPGKNFSSGVQEPQTPRLCDLIQETTVLLIGQLATAGFLVSHGQVVVAVGAFQRAASGHLDRSIHRDPVFEEPLVKLQAELGIVLVFHRLPLACSMG